MQNPSIDTALWLLGMSISLGVFAVKTGCGLGFARATLKEVGLVYGGYIVLFVILSLVAEDVVGALSGVLGAGIYLHAIVAVAFIGWALWTLRNHSVCCTERQKKASLLLLVIPCPVCTAAIAYSVWSAVAFTGSSPLLMGGLLLVVFLTLTTVFLFLARASKERGIINLSFTLFLVGLYFILSLFVPAVVEKAKPVYSGFLGARSPVTLTADAHGVVGILILAAAIGFITRGRRA